jgi:hypothetical protein
LSELVEQIAPGERPKTLVISEVDRLLFVNAYYRLPGVSEGEWVGYYSVKET